jgi:hypothetical protein
MTERNHLGKALLIKPEVFEKVMTQMFTSVRYADNPLSTALAGKAERTIGSTEWEWELKGANTRPLVIYENVESSANTTPGKFKQPFKMKLDENWYLPGDVIHPGTSNKKYQVRIQSKGIPHDVAWLYEVRGMTDDAQWFLDPKYLNAGQQWAKLFSQYEEGAEQSGSTQYALPIALTSRMGRYRKMYSVTGDAAQEVLAIAIQGSDGKMYTSWVKYAEVEYWEQWYRELERGYWYSRSTDTVLGATGRPIYSGPGVQELLEDSIQHPYTVLTTKLIEEFLMDIFYSRVKPGKARRIEAYTGEYGMIQFHRAIQDWAERRRGFISVVDTNFIGKDSSEYNENALVAGYQYTRYRMANGAELKLVHQPLYDDREINFEIDPVTGYPMESQRITFLDFSNQDGANSNIMLMNRTNSFKLAYVVGLQSPYGPVNKGFSAHSGDYYEMHVQKQCGVTINDISRCGELILARS